jgi:uncharacterized protein YndB with AHSA1/START domain
MTVTEEAAPVLVVRHTIAVPRQRVFDAWLDSEAMARWMRPGKVTHSTVEVEPRVGGSFRSRCTAATASASTTAGVPRHRAAVAAVVHLDLEATDHKPTVVTIEFLERGTGTELVLTHQRLAPKAIEGIAAAGPTRSACSRRS